jgi:hypothetical protein
VAWKGCAAHLLLCTDSEVDVKRRGSAAVHRRPGGLGGQRRVAACWASVRAWGQCAATTGGDISVFTTMPMPLVRPSLQHRRGQGPGSGLGATPRCTGAAPLRSATSARLNTKRVPGVRYSGRCRGQGWGQQAQQAQQAWQVAEAWLVGEEATHSMRSASAGRAGARQSPRASPCADLEEAEAHARAVATAGQAGGAGQRGTALRVGARVASGAGSPTVHAGQAQQRPPPGHPPAQALPVHGHHAGGLPHNLAVDHRLVARLDGGGVRQDGNVCAGNSGGGRVGPKPPRLATRAAVHEGKAWRVPGGFQTTALPAPGGAGQEAREGGAAGRCCSAHPRQTPRTPWAAPSRPPAPCPCAPAPASPSSGPAPPSGQPPPAAGEGAWVCGVSGRRLMGQAARPAGRGWCMCMGWAGAARAPGPRAGACSARS